MTGKKKDNKDEASIFKQQSLNAIRRKRMLRNFFFSSMTIIALTLIIAVILSYVLI